jgi:hypothetical protein
VLETNLHYAGRTEIGNWCIVLIDTHVPGEDGGAIAREALEDLDATLSAQADRHVLICLHHHPVAIGSAWLDALGITNRDSLFAVINRHRNVRALLWGHVHQSFDEHSGDLRLLATPTVSVRRTDALPLRLAAAGPRWLSRTTTAGRAAVATLMSLRATARRVPACAGAACGRARPRIALARRRSRQQRYLLGSVHVLREARRSLDPKRLRRFVGSGQGSTVTRRHTFGAVMAKKPGPGGLVENPARRLRPRIRQAARIARPRAAARGGPWFTT